MKIFTKPVGLLFIFLAGFFAPSVNGQSILNPTDSVITYNPAAPPAQPASGKIGKWVRTVRLSWNTTEYKCYIYGTNAFRLKYPKSYNPTANDGKKYPMLIFLHGLGEAGTIYDNEYSLYHGGDVFNAAVDNGTFDGYVLIMQTSDGFWGPGQFSLLRGIIDYMVPNNKLDPFRVNVNGLSAGGAGTWDFLISQPDYISAALPMSATSINYMTTATANLIKFTPMWEAQGGLDEAPGPYTAHQVRDYMLAAGANLTYTEYPTLGHDTWDQFWTEPNFWPFLLASYSANPWPLTGKSQFCPGTPISATLGLAPGFDQYEWRLNGVVIPGQTTNQISVTQLGTYSARVRRGTFWSDTSHVPVVLQIKAPTVPPTITIPPLHSNVIPALDTNGVLLSVPSTYTSYLWEMTGSTTSLSTTNSYFATIPGNYAVQVVEPFGCAGSFSTPYTVINANGPNKPDAASGLAVTTISKTSLRLDWTNNPTPQYNETGFEIYQATTSGGPYKLINITAPDVITYTISGLTSNTKYYYVIRAVDATAASAKSNEALGTTQADTQPPTVPTNLTITGTSRTSASLTWTGSTDDVGLKGYDIFVNGQFWFFSDTTNYVVTGLTYGQAYTFTVKAKDLAGNLSPNSNQVAAIAKASGLGYKYYTFIGTWNDLPDFTTISPTYAGSESNVSITPRTQEINYSFLWEGFITIPTTGTYTFRTNSDDGSRLWLGSLNGTGSPYSFAATPMVNNDGLHGTQNVTGTPVTLTAGVYPIAIAYYQEGGGESITVSWQTPASGANFVTIPDSAFVENINAPGVIPAAPSNLSATAISFKSIGLTWIDNSTNETAFEVYRSSNAKAGFTIVGQAAAGATSYTDSVGLNGSTRYYYEIRAIGQYGQSDYTSSYVEANWKFENNYADSSGNNVALTANSSPTFDAVNKIQGSYALKLNGTNQSVNISNTGSFLQEAYAQRTVALWIKSNSNTGKRIIFDIGGSDNGIALELDSSKLIAGIASASVRTTISAPYTSTGWNHVAVSYYQNTLTLYVNGIVVANTSALPFTSLKTTTNAARIAGNNGSNAFNNNGALFSGWIDDMGIYYTALNTKGVNDVMNFAYKQSNATTLILPALPAAPTGLTAVASSTSSIRVSWTDVATNEDNYLLYRSTNTDASYTLLKTLPANTVSYLDSGLFANSTFFYKVQAANVGGASAFPTEVSATTKDNLPVISPIGTTYMRYGTQLLINLTATDPDKESVSLQVTGIPAFASFASTGNGTGVLTVNSTQTTDQGTYSGIIVTATDQHGGVSTTGFTLIVNNNYPPHITPVTGTTLNEKQTAQISLTATDQNAGDILTWSFTGLPAFATAQTTTGNSIQINLAPGFSDNGVYNVKAKVNDGNNGTDTTSFTITVNDVNPNTITYISFTDGSAGNVGVAPWNNTGKSPIQGDNYANMKDQNGINTGIGLQMTSNWQSFSNNYGATGGVYPDPVMRSAYFTDPADPQTIRIYGLSLGVKYSFTFFGSRAGVTDVRNSVYTINGVSDTLNASSNTQKTVTMNNVTAAADGSVVLSLKAAAGSSYAYLNAMVIQSIYNDSTAPAKARNLAGVASGNGIGLTWVDAAYNETAYQIYKATQAAGPYTLINPGGNNANLQAYKDSIGILGSSTYYYYVTSSNQYGISPSSDTVAVAVPNVPPVITNIPNVNMKTGQTLDVNVIATDNPTDIITLNVTGLPNFATFTNNGNGTGVIHLVPGMMIGTYSGITVTATDNSGASSSTQFQVVVAQAGITSIFVNFNQVTPVGAPWNSFNSLPNAGQTISGLVNDAGTVTGSSIILVDGFENANNLGAVTGNNSGVFPDSVMATAYFESTTATRRVKVTGLTSANNTKYNLIFFGSRGNANDNRNTIYAIAGQSVTLNASGNTNNTVQINSLVPDSTGSLTFTVTKGAGASYAYINAVVIQSYIDMGQVPAPTNLVATGKSSSSTILAWSDNTSNETGFEISRSTTLNGAYTVVTVTAPNATTYTDGGLLPNTSYYYKVRTVVGTNFSLYSNTAYAATFTYQAFINFNDGSLPAPYPWFNTNKPPQQGDVYSSISDSTGKPTGIHMTVMDANWSGVNVYGMNTGNNSGVYPDNVIRETWWLDVGGTATLKIDGLNQSLQYNFVFFASRDLMGVIDDRTSVYGINGQTVTVNAANNISQTAQINNIRADQNGAAFITIHAGGASAYGYLGSLVVQASKIDTSSLSGGNFVTNGIGDNSLNSTLEQSNLDSSLVSLNSIRAYPNPFVNDVNLEVTLGKSIDKMTILVSDMSGKTVLVKELNNLQRGANVQSLGLNKQPLSPGIYIIQAIGSDGTRMAYKIIKFR